MEIKTLSSKYILIKSKITDFVLENLNLTDALNWIVNRIKNIENTNAAIIEDYKEADIALHQKIEGISFESECDIEIEYIPNSGNKFKINRTLDDMIFESETSKLTFTIDHQLGVTPIIQIYTKLLIDEDYSYTLTDFTITEETLQLVFTEPVFCKVIFKA